MNPAATKARILAATDELFGSIGFDATTTRDIAEASGINKALIHYHFGSKDELLTELLAGYYARLSAALGAALATPAASLEGRVLNVVDAYAAFLADNRAFCNIVQREVGSGHHVDKIVAGTVPLFELGTTWLGAVGPAAAPGLELVHVLTSVYGMVVTYFTYGRVIAQLTGQDPFTPAALAARRRHIHRMVRMLFRELGLEAAPDVPPRPEPRARRIAARPTRTRRPS